MATLVSLQLRFAGGVGIYHATSYSTSGDRSRVAFNDRLSYGSGLRIASYPRMGHLQGGGTLCCPLRSHPTMFRNRSRVRAAWRPVITSSVRPLPMELELKPIVVMIVNYGSQFLKRTAALFQMCPPLVAEVVPAVGLVIYAVWVLGPTTRILRKLVFKRNDKKWEESRTYNIMASYMRPILMWIGIILVCRAFDPLTLSTEYSQAIKQRFVNFVRSLSTVLAFAFCTASLTQQVQKFMMENQDAEDSRTVGVQFVGNTVYTAVWVAAVCLFMELLGFSTQKWITAGGFGTVLITLAGREIFTNFLSSIMIHATRPFVDNEWIQTKIEGQEVSGTVEHVGWWSPTVIRGDDREAIHIPNHKFSVSVVRNLSQKTHWRIKTHLGISHLDFSKLKPLIADMRKVLAKHPQVEQRRLHRRVFFDTIDPENQSLMILISCFVKTSHFEEYLRVKEVILLDLLKVIGHHGARLATPIRSVQRVLDEAESRSSPYRDMRNSNQSQRRPFLLRDSQVPESSDDEAEDDEDDIQDTISRLSEQLAKVGKAAVAFTENVESASDLKSASVKAKDVAVDGSLQTPEKPTSSDDESLPQENSENLMDMVYAGTEETLVKPHITDIGPSSLEVVKGATISEERVVEMPEERDPQLYSNNVGLDDSPLLDGEIRASSVNVHTDQTVETTEDQQVLIDKHVGLHHGNTPLSDDPWKQPSTSERDGEKALEDSLVTINDEFHVQVTENVRDKHAAFESSSIDDPWKQHFSEDPLDSLQSESSSSQAASNCEDLWSRPSATIRPVVDTKLIPGVAIEGPKHTLPLDEDIDDSPTLVGPGKSEEGAAAFTGAIPSESRDAERC